MMMVKEEKKEGKKGMKEDNMERKIIEKEGKNGRKKGRMEG